MNVRMYRSEDCKEIVELFYNTVHSINAKDYNEAQLDAWAPKDIDISKWDKSLLEHYSIVIEDNNIIIGFGDLDINGYFDRLYVHKDYQGAYVATIIVKEIEKYAQENKIKVITTHSSITAKPFFEKQGYKVIKEQVVERKGQILKNFIMEKTLTLNLS
ncbi:GNAT family N-acetyltransferase [Clostridium baratii]|uniref:Acetyltransferase n=1 Tax=Clostridium baratii TaxID=1561 RepID=A0A174RXD9_9CLOT|nr:GNAT family N-acetyltransferase [Clostridium baratii]OPF52346.1 acetyltransferase [Clostridium baratii]OPF55796.1 GNAT family N-acetyltransferase [Clostridium baratii]OPF56824.1 GNAT family N-acetyltransferase [Clostridium baratii]OPF59823.1 GNAT family N-acetyltransferase [Clostridium baratii]CUP87855.1 acetyltransferase [Clostridium baratii]